MLAVLVVWQKGRYTVRREKPGQRGSGGGSKKSPAQGESIAFMMLAGIAVGVAVGYGVDWLVKTFPLFTVVGVFAGFGLALYAVFLETK